jgi:hypothetical protein
MSRDRNKARSEGFAPGDTIVATTSCQGMVEGVVYEVVARHTLHGRFIEYELRHSGPQPFEGEQRLLVRNLPLLARRSD